MKTNNIKTHTGRLCRTGLFNSEINLSNFMYEQRNVSVM